MQGILTDNTELKKLILENPDLPLLVFVTDDANSGNYCTELASCKCRKGIVLDADKTNVYLPSDERIYCDDDDLEDDMRDALCDEFAELSDSEFDNMIAEKMKELEPYWKECIILTVHEF